MARYAGVSQLCGHSGHIWSCFGRVGARKDRYKNLEIPKAAKSYEKSSFSYKKLLFVGSRRRIRTLTNRVRVTIICKLRCISACFLVMLILFEKERKFGGRIDFFKLSCEKVLKSALWKSRAWRSFQRAFF